METIACDVTFPTSWGEFYSTATLSCETLADIVTIALDGEDPRAEVAPRVGGHRVAVTLDNGGTFELDRDELVLAMESQGIELEGRL